MANMARALSALLTVAMLAACSSGSFAPTAQAALANDAHHVAKGSLMLRIVVPKKKKTRRQAPHYISAATQAMTIAIIGLTDVNKTVALTPNANGCSSSLAGTLCTLTVPGLKPCPSSANCYGATIATYDAVTGCPSACTIPETAHKLSANQTIVFSIAAGRADQIDATLDAIPASVVLVPDPDATLSGNMASGLFPRKMWFPSAARWRPRPRCRP